jgi:agarase
VTDDTLAWAQRPESGRPSLLQLCLSLEPNFAAYHAAWEFVLALHGGRLESVAKAWNVPVGNKEVVREFTRRENGIATRGYCRDQAQWSREVARRYFAATATAVRLADPNHLVFGCRFRERAAPEVLAECSYPSVDVSMPDWRDLPQAGAGVGQQPLLAGEVSWADAEFLRAPARGSMARLTTVERMLRRGRAALERMARHPAVVGYAWSQWQDGPAEQPPFARGVLHHNGAEAREHTELLAQFNLRADALHRRSQSGLLPHEIPPA